jgi:hypothetical protein
LYEKPTVISYLLESDKDFLDEWEEKFTFLNISPMEIPFDLSVRNVVTDCLDFDNPIEIKEFFL